MDSKKAFERVWHAALWTTIRYSIGANFTRVIKYLCDKDTSAVPFNSSLGDWFRTTVGVRQGCLLLPTLFNIFLKRIMTDSFEEHDGTVSIKSRTITNLRLADDIDDSVRGTWTGNFIWASRQSVYSLQLGDCHETHVSYWRLYLAIIHYACLMVYLTSAVIVWMCMTPLLWSAGLLVAFPSPSQSSRLHD